LNEDFRYITAIAEHGSISKAARAAHVSQPALSQRLKRLETQLGTELFTRGTSPLRPTASGEVFLDYARKAIAAEDSMRRDVFSVAHQGRRSLRIGVSMARANAFLPEPIVSFYETHQGCTLELRELSSLKQMHDLFITDKIDFAVLTPISPDPNAYYTEVLCHERLMAVVSSQLRVPQLENALLEKVSLRQLEGIPFVLPTCGNYFDPLISRMIDVFGVQLDIVVRDCSAEMALAMVRDGLGVALAPSTWLTGQQDLRAFELDGIEAGNVLRYVRRHDRNPSQEEQLFISILRDWLMRPGAPPR